MKPLIVLLSLSLIVACSATKEVPELILPELIVQYPLPAYPYPVASAHLRIEFKLLVGEDGAVRFAELMNGSGNNEWDASALAVIKTWRYTPALYQGKALKLWLKQTAVVQFSEPQYVELQEIVFFSKSQADSVYVLLERGYGFDEMAQRYSTAASRVNKGLLGKVNIQVYPSHIKQALTALDNNQITSPLKFGDRYVIFKRMKDEDKLVLP